MQNCNIFSQRNSLIWHNLIPCNVSIIHLLHTLVNIHWVFLKIHEHHQSSLSEKTLTLFKPASLPFKIVFFRILKLGGEVKLWYSIELLAQAFSQVFIWQVCYYRFTTKFNYDLIKVSVNRFHATGSFLYPLKTSWCFQEVEKQTSGMNWVN